MAKDRQTRIPETDPDASSPERWELDGEGFTVTNPEMVYGNDREEAEDDLARALYEATVVLRRIGGVVSFAPVRVELAPEIFVTTEYAMRWNSYSPPVREVAPPEAEEVVEPVA
jgi:hypothetical protein